MADLTILPISPNDEGTYLKLAENWGTVFDSPRWANLFGKNIARYGFFTKSGEMLGGFFLYREKRAGLSVYRNPRFTPFIGPFLKNEAKNPAQVNSNWKNALAVMAEFVDKLPFAVFSVALSRNIIDTQPFIWRNFKAIVRYTYTIDLNIETKAIYSSMSADRRKSIKKAAKDGLEVKPVKNFDIVYDLTRKTFERQQVRINDIYLKKILFEYSQNGNCFAYATYSKSTPLACVFCVSDNQRAYYLIGGYDDIEKHHGAGPLAMWEAINHAQRNGLKVFDFEGSSVPQIERYFRGFGGKLEPVFTVNKAKFIIELFLKYFNRDLF